MCYRNCPSIVPTYFFSDAYWSRNICFTCSGNKWNITLRNKTLFNNFPLFGILKFTKKTLSLVSAWSVVLSFLSAHGVLNCICFTCSGYMCYRNFYVRNFLESEFLAYLYVLHSLPEVESLYFYNCSGNMFWLFLSSLIPDACAFRNIIVTCSGYR